MVPTSGPGPSRRSRISCSYSEINGTYPTDDTSVSPPSPYPNSRNGFVLDKSPTFRFMNKGRERGLYVPSATVVALGTT